MKLAAERLLKIADDLEKEAAENTFFVCDGCNHTSSLADINAKRKTAAEQHKVKRVANVSVNDSVTCLACGGKMSYVPTDMSDKYYVEAEDDEDTGSDIFEPVDEQGKDETPDETSDVAETKTDETPTVDDTVTETTETPEGDESVSETSETTETPEGDTSGETTDEITDYDGNPEDNTSEETDVAEDTEDSPEPDAVEKSPESDVGDTSLEGEPAPVENEMLEGEPEESPEGEGGAVEEETVTDETENLPMDDETSDEKETPVDEDGVELPKKDVPKFEKIPKDASDPFWRSVAKYTI
jgi:hypothetical protein